MIYAAEKTASWCHASTPNGSRRTCRAKLHVVPNAWHFAFVDPPTVPIPSDDGDLRDDPPGFDRQALLRQLQTELPAFFDAVFAASPTMP